MAWRFWESKATRIAREAAVWRTEIDDPDSRRDAAQFETWLRLDPAHLKAYAAIDGVASLGSGLGARPEAMQSASVSISRTALAAAAAIALFFVGMVWVGRDTGPAFAAVSNGGRAVRTVALRDGTPVALDIGATIEVATDPAAPEVRVRAGRVRFDATGGSGRIAVSTPAGLLVAENSIVDVAVVGDRLQVSLVRGRTLLLARTGRQAPAPLAIAEGQSMSLDAGGTSGAAVSTADLAWPLGSVAVDQRPLSDILVLANRPGEPPIVVADDTIGDLRVTGVLDLRDTRKLANKLAAALDLRVRSRGGALVLSR